MSQAVATKLLQDNYTASGGANAGALPWAAIIQAILTLLPQVCPPKTAKRWVKNHPEAAKEAIRHALESDAVTSTVSHEDRDIVVDSAYDSFLLMSADEIRAAKA